MLHMKVGFIGRTKILYDAITLFQKSDEFEISYIWSCKDEEYYNFDSKNFEEISGKIGCQYIFSSEISSNIQVPHVDLVISINFINLIPKSFIEGIPYGVINAHAGDLPRYRGNACANWAIINGEDKIGLSIHKMDAGLDSGPIIQKKYFPLQSNTYIGEVYDWFEEIVPQLFLDSAHKLRDGYIPKPQDGDVLRTFPRIREDGRLNFNFSRDWNYNLIRASSIPFDGAYCYLNNSNQKIVIFEANPINIDYDFNAISGQIMERNSEDLSFLIAIGKDVLRISNYSINGLSTEESYSVICKSLRNRLT